MKLVRLEAENFRSFARIDLDLNASGLFSITGPNGAGKSSIFGAVEWALYGGKRGLGAEDLRRQGADGECRVELDFEVGGRLLRVVRVDHGDASLTDLETGQQLVSGLTSTSREVAVALGLTQDMFAGTFYARQKQVEALSHTKFDARKNQLERLLGIEHLRHAAELASRDAREQKLLVESLSEELPDLDELRAEVEHTEREVQEAAPTVKCLQTKIGELEGKLKVVVDRIDALAGQIKEHSLRQLAAEKKASELTQQRAALEQLIERRDAATTAKLELFELEPVANALDQLKAHEREMELGRRGHEQAEALRAQERKALKELAEATDELSDLGNDTEGEDPAASLGAAQQALNEKAGQLRLAAKVRQSAEERAREANQLLERATQAFALEGEIAKFGNSEHELERSRQRWQGLQVAKADLEAQLAHNRKHRDALRGVEDAEAGICPTCRQPLTVGLDDLRVGFESEIKEGEIRLSELVSDINAAAIEGKKQREIADRLADLRARREGLGELGDHDELTRLAKEAAGVVEKAVLEERELEQAHGKLQVQIPELQARVASAGAVARKRVAIREKLIKAEQQVATYAEQRSNLAANDYDPEAHASLKSEMEQAEAAARRCIVLRQLIDGESLLKKQIDAQTPRVTELANVCNQLRQAASEIAPENDAHEKLAAKRDLLSEELDEKRVALGSAQQKVSLESRAVSAARARLDGAKDQFKHVDSERRELELRSAVAGALEDYREHASQRARPMLEEEASNLLKRVTRSTYPAVRLTDRYLLEIVDGNRFHPSRRFSGGEQDLAALCLRLALARTLAHQRGVEHSFVVLDEVFGSQDVDRRRTLMEQLGELADAEFQQIFVISHTDDIISHCSLHIQVDRENGISSVTGPSA